MGEFEANTHSSDAPNQQPHTKSSSKSSPSKEDYIDFEEVK